MIPDNLRPLPALSPHSNSRSLGHSKVRGSMLSVAAALGTTLCVASFTGCGGFGDHADGELAANDTPLATHDTEHSSSAATTLRAGRAEPGPRMRRIVGHWGDVKQEALDSMAPALGHGQPLNAGRRAKANRLALDVLRPQRGE